MKTTSVKKGDSSLEARIKARLANNEVVHPSKIVEYNYEVLKNIEVNLEFFRDVHSYIALTMSLNNFCRSFSFIERKKHITMIQITVDKNYMNEGYACYRKKEQFTEIHFMKGANTLSVCLTNDEGKYIYLTELMQNLSKSGKFVQLLISVSDVHYEKFKETIELVKKLQPSDYKEHLERLKKLEENRIRRQYTPISSEDLYIENMRDAETNGLSEEEYKSAYWNFD